MATIAVPLGAEAEGQEADAIKRPALSEYLRWSVDHKIIGVQYGISSFLFFIIGGAMAMLIRLELWSPDLDLMVSGAAYNSLFTIHGTIMIFLFIIPMWAAFGNFVVPLQLGAKDMAFPWLNAFAFWLIPPAAVVVLLGYFVSPAEAGWTSYPPLSTIFSGDGQTLWALGAHLLGISSIMGSINFIVTIFNMRPPEMTIWRMPLLCWAVLATSIIAVMATPFLAGALTLLLLDRVAGTTFFDAAGGGDVHGSRELLGEGLRGEVRAQDRQKEEGEDDCAVEEAFHDQGGQGGREADGLQAAVGVGASRFARAARGQEIVGHEANRDGREARTERAAWLHGREEVAPARCPGRESRHGDDRGGEEEGPVGSPDVAPDGREVRVAEEQPQEHGDQHHHDEQRPPATRSRPGRPPRRGRLHRAARSRPEEPSDRAPGPVWAPPARSPSSPGRRAPAPPAPRARPRCVRC